MSVTMRIAGATLGLVNAIILVGYLLRYLKLGDAELQSMVNSSPVAVALTAALPGLVLAASGMAALFILGIRVMRFVRARQATPPLASPRPTPSVTGMGSSSAATSSVAGNRTPASASPAASAVPPTPSAAVRQQQEEALRKMAEKVKELER
jgi:hypothetical protein